MKQVACGISCALLSALVFAGCTPALPLRGAEAGSAVQESEKALLALEDTKAALAEIQSEVRRNEKLLSEARSILKQVRDSEAGCRLIVAKIPKRPKVVYIEKPVPVASEGEGAGSGSTAPQQGAAAAPPPATTGYSKSDAPGGIYVPRGAVGTTTLTTLAPQPTNATSGSASAPLPALPPAASSEPIGHDVNHGAETPK